MKGINKFTRLFSILKKKNVEIVTGTQQSMEPEMNGNMKFDMYGFICNLIPEEKEEIFLDAETLQAQWDTILGSSEKIQDCIEGGFPHSLRAKLWKHLARSDVCASRFPSDYFENLVAKGENSCTEQIILDLDRTFPTHRSFIDRTAQESLFKILCAYSWHNSNIGYCQGMSYVASTLLLVIENTEDTFWTFVSVMDGYQLGKLYTSEMTGIFITNEISRFLALQEGCNLFARILQKSSRELYVCLKENGIDTLLYIAPLWLQMFTNLTNWHTVLRIWDLFLMEGKISLYRFSLALLLSCKDNILSASSFEDIITLVLRFPSSNISPSRIAKIGMDLDIQKLISEATAESSVISPPSKTPSNLRARRSIGKSTSSKKETAKKKQSEAKQSSFFSRLISDFTNLTTDTPKKRPRDDSPMNTPLGLDKKKRRSENTTFSPLKKAASPRKGIRSFQNKENWVNATLSVDEIRRTNPQSFNEFTTPTKSPKSKIPLSSNRSNSKLSDKKVSEKNTKPIELVDFTLTKL